VDANHAIRDATADADLPTFSLAPAGCELSVFSPVAADEVITAIRRLPDKQCDTVVWLPTWLFKHCAVELAPFLCRLFNRSFTEGACSATSVQGGVHYSAAQEV